MKSPKATKRGDTWRIQFMYEGHRYSSTHDTEKQAQEWAIRKMISLKDQGTPTTPAQPPEHTYLEAMQVYIQNVTQKKKGARWETLRLNKIIRENPRLVEKKLSKLTKMDFTNYKENRLKEVLPTTVSREMEILSAVMNYCVNDLGWLHQNIMKSVKRPTESAPRNRRASDEEIQKIIEKCGYSAEKCPSTKLEQVGWCTLFAVETAMRMSEITDMTWKNVHLEKLFIRLPTTKNGTERSVPLSLKAENLLRQIKSLDKEKVLTIESNSLSTMFRRKRDECKIKDLHFHDLRHEAITRMAQIIQNPADLAKITGHTDINILVNVYYNPTPTEVAQRLRAAL